jgi:hypothetical protein
LFENRVLRKILVPKRDEFTGEWKRLRNQKFFDLYSSRNIIRMIKSRSIRWEGHVTLTGDREIHTEFWWGNLRERAHLEGLGIDERIILKWIFK